MKLAELKFYLGFAKGMSAVTDFICGVLENYDENNSCLYITDDWLNNIKSSLGTSLGSVLKEENNANKELISGFANMVDIISRGDHLFLDKNKGVTNKNGKKCYILKDRKVFESNEVAGVFKKFANTLDKYLTQNDLYYSLGAYKFSTDLELEVSRMLSHNQSFFSLIDFAASENGSSVLVENYQNKTKGYVTTLEDINDRQAVKYLARNKQDQLLTYKEGNELKYVMVDKKRDIYKYINASSVENPDDMDSAIIDKKDLADYCFPVEKKVEENKVEVKQEIKKEIKPEKKQEVKKIPVKKKKQKFNLFKSIKNIFNRMFGWVKYIGRGVKKGVKSGVDGVLDICDDITLTDIFLCILPTLIMVTYLVLLLTGVMDQITFSSSNFKGTLLGYDFELSGLMVDWLENTDHGFFSAITLGLIQIVLIVVGFVLDLIVHALFLVLSLVLFILMMIFAMCFYYVFPIAIAILCIINFFRGEEDKKTMLGICMIISVISCVLYFLFGMNVL